MMSTRDLLLLDLYNTPQDTQAQAIAARCAPAIYFDAREPFLPLAAGYTLFAADDRSPSFDRVIELRVPEKPAASLAIEYAIWWDWDIHHLYELEHVWVYLDTEGQVVRVEGSWHGKYYDIPVVLEGGHPVLLSEPGKHAFAPDPGWFHQRQHEYRRAETRYVGVHAHVLINNMFAGKIRQRVFDRVLVRSFLTRSAFEPAWSFTQRFAFPQEMLVPWPALYEWIPQRVNTWLERLEANTRPADYRALRLVGCDGTLAGLQSAAQAGADAVTAPISLRGNRLMLGSDPTRPLVDLEEAYEFCNSEPMAAFLELTSPAVLDRLAWFVRSKELQEYTIVTSADAGLLASYKSYVPESAAVIQLLSTEQDPLRAARESRAAFVNPRWDLRDDAPRQLSEEWIQHVHQAGSGIVGWPVETADELEQMQHDGLDVTWQMRP